MIINDRLSDKEKQSIKSLIKSENHLKSLEEAINLMIDEYEERQLEIKNIDGKNVYLIGQENAAVISYHEYIVIPHNEIKALHRAILNLK
jgi:chromosome segregation and condensation protein ScpB